MCSFLVEKSSNGFSNGTGSNWTTMCFYKTDSLKTMRKTKTILWAFISLYLALVSILFSGSSGCTPVRVQIPASAPKENGGLADSSVNPLSLLMILGQRFGQQPSGYHLYAFFHSL
jgi:hypothetical protein